jgi:2-amino-4-hydroxy-6-hydroxymethyldihydropteridine diphosphokinase
MIHTIYLALGSNLGDRPGNLETAIQALAPDVRVLERSSIYETPPWGFVDQPTFFNMVLKAETRFSSRQLLKMLKALESRLGRQPGYHNGPRLIDLDIPHPRLHERSFVLVPLAEIAPDLVHPALNKNIRDLLAAVDCQGIQRYLP